MTPQRPPLTLLAPLALALAVAIADPLGAGEALTAFAADGGRVTVCDERGDLVSIGPMGWGPKWAWTAFKGDARDDQGASVNELTAKLGGTGVPMKLELRATRTDPRT